jgi:hypothetical protein
MAPQARIENLAVPSTKEREPIEVDFTYIAEKPPIVALDVVLTTPLGAVHELLPASLAVIEGPRGAGRFAIDLRTLPPRASDLTLALVLLEEAVRPDSRHLLGRRRLDTPGLEGLWKSPSSTTQSRHRTTDAEGGRRIGGGG